MEQLKTKRKIIKSMLTRFANSITQVKKRIGRKLTVEKAEELWDQFDTVQTGIELIDEEEECQRGVIEETYFRAFGQTKQLIVATEHEALREQTRSVTISSHSNAIRVKLPAINLPKFTANYTEWLTLRDSFRSIIDQDDGLTSIQKYQYLRGALQNEALQVIQSKLRMIPTQWLGIYYKEGLKIRNSLYTRI